MNEAVMVAAPERAGTKREVAAWCLYDFASSAFNTLMITFIFNRYYTDVIGGGTDRATFLWTLALNISAVTVAVAMPVLGAIADYSGRKKLFLGGFAIQSIIFTTLLFFVGPGDAIAAFVLFVIANIGFEAGNVFYNAFLPEIAPGNRVGRVSGYGYFLGYIGGLLCLVLGLGMVRGWLPQTNYLHVRGTILLVAAWWLVFAMPMLLWVRERAERRAAPPHGYVREGFRRLIVTFTHIRELKEAVKLLVARMIYNDGLTTVIAVASIYAGAVLGMTLEEVLAMGIALNVAAGIGAFLFGFVDDRIGGKKTLIITLVALTIAGIIGVGTTTVAGFWVAATLIGVMMGPNQSASRSLLSRLVPEHKHAEAFGLFAFSGKLSSMLGPLVYGSVVAATGNHKLAMSSIVVFFVVGLAVLLTVREQEGIELARRMTAEVE